MITPIKTMTINQIAERKDDLLMSDDDIKEMARNVRNKAIDEFAERLFNCGMGDFSNIPISEIKRIAEQMKGGAE